MKTFQGIGVSTGIVLERALKYVPQEATISRTSCSNPAEEEKAFDEALARAYARTEVLYVKAKERSGGKEADIFDAHLAILSDDISIRDPIVQLIQDGSSAEQAVFQHFNELKNAVEALEDDYFLERGSDFEALQQMLLQELLGTKGQDLSVLERDVIVVARQLTPSDTVQMDLGHVKGILCERGAPTSHTAILARALGIPAVVSCPGGFDAVNGDEIILLDGETGEVILSPNDHQRTAGTEKAERIRMERLDLEQYRTMSSATKDGHTVYIHANIGSTAECIAAMEAGGEGVGLFRTEFLYMEEDSLPNEERQYRVYRNTLEEAHRKPVTIRTLDVGGDKSIPSLGLPKEENPFLGYRAIRICLDRKPIFKTQLRALYRASTSGTLKIMFPMIGSLEELWEAKAVVKEVLEELSAEGIPFDESVKIGIMVEVPAVAEMAELFAKEVDFFSIGTNDLIQYTLAVDRGNEKIKNLYTHYHPAVIRMIRRSIDAAHERGISCSVCGEAAADLMFAPILLGLGLDSFSVSASSILKLRKLICGLTFAGCKRTAERALKARTAEEVRRILSEEMNM